MCERSPAQTLRVQIAPVCQGVCAPETHNLALSLARERASIRSSHGHNLHGTTNVLTAFISLEGRSARSGGR
jgi:hypothetical protein